MLGKEFRIRGLVAFFAVIVLALGAAACGDDEPSGGTSAGLIEANPDNNGVEVTVGSKNFNEQFILGEIYAQALEAAGYDVKKELNLGDEQIALASLKNGEISGYPEYTNTAATSFFDIAPEDIPSDVNEARDQLQPEFEKIFLTAFAPTSFSSVNAVGLLTSKAEELGVETISDLEGVSQDLTLFGPPECRQRVDCLVGLQNAGLEFKGFTPVAIDLRYEVLDKGQADLSILFTTDANLFTDPDTYTVLVDDQGLFPAGNPTFIASQAAVEAAGPDFQATIEQVQEGLTLEVLQELNARVEIDKETPEQAASEYLKEAGYTA